MCHWRGSPCGFVQLSLERGVFLAHAHAHAGRGFRGPGQRRPCNRSRRAGFGLQEGVERDSVGLDGVDATGGEILIGFVLGLVFLDFGGGRGEVLLHIVRMHGGDLHADDLAGKAFRGRLETVFLAADDAGGRVVIFVGEVDRLQPLAGDRHRGDDHVDLLRGQLRK